VLKNPGKCSGHIAMSSGAPTKQQSTSDYCFSWVLISRLYDSLNGWLLNTHWRSQHFDWEEPKIEYAPKFFQGLGENTCSLKNTAPGP